MQWSDVLADSSLQDLPYKIELDEYGRIVMSPATNRHSELQGDLYFLLRRALAGQGKPLVECSIETTKGVKVADVAWRSHQFLNQYGSATPYPHAPELCVEIVSPSNRRPELREKIALYLAAGAREVWIVAEDRQIEIYGPNGRLNRSQFIDPIPLE